MFYGFRLFYYSTSFSNDDFYPFKNSAKEARLLRNDILSLKLRCHGLSSTYCIENKSKSCESQGQSLSHRVTGESKQNITANLSHWNPRKKDDGSIEP